MTALFFIFYRMAHLMPVPESLREMIRDFLTASREDMRRIKFRAMCGIYGLPDLHIPAWKKLGIKTMLKCKDRYREAMLLARFDSTIEIIIRNPHYNEMMAEQGSKRATWIVDDSVKNKWNYWQ